MTPKVFFRMRMGCLIAMFLTAAAAQGNAQARQPVELRVMATTDVHGRIRAWDYFADSAESGRGLARLATVVDSVRADKPHGSILLDAGDFLQGNALTYVASRASYTALHPVVAAYNALKYDAVVLGNHEFNYGLATLDRVLAPATFSVLGANVRRMDGGKQWTPITYLLRGGVRVAIIGLTTPWAMVWDRELLRGKMHIDDIVASARRAVGDARRGGADVVVVLAHAGLDPASGVEDTVPGVARENPMTTVALEVPGIDLIVFGHSHREVADTSINGVLLMQPRNWASSLAVASIRVEPAGAGWRVASKRGGLVRAAGHAEQQAIADVAATGHAAARRYANTTIGNTTAAWSTDSARTVDVPLMDFVGETIRRASGADLASTAVFSTRIRIAPGPITVAQLAQLYPYDNTLRIVKLSGAKLKEYLEQSARYFRVTGDGADATAAPDPSFIGFNFEVVTGATYMMDLSRPVGNRIAGLSVKGRPVAPTDSFSIALTNYRASGTGGYTMLLGAPVVKDDQREVRQLLIDELTRRRALRPEDYFIPTWSVGPAALAAQVQSALSREGDFDAVPRSPAGSPPSRPPSIGTQAGTKASTLRLIGVSDFHGGFEARPDGNAGMRGGAAHFAAVIRKLERECSGACTSLLVDGGDQFQGTPASNLAYGRPVVAMFNAIGLAAAAIGNHDFDWGQDTLRARMREAKYGMFAANVTSADGRAVPWIRPDTLVERGGLKVGIIGLATVTTPTITMPRHVLDLRFHRPGPIVVERARLLRARGADLVVVVAHAGANCGSDGCSGEMAELAREAGGSIDAIVGGHNHVEFSTILNGVPIVRARSSGRGVRYVDIPVARAARTAMEPKLIFVNTDSITPDPEVLRVVSDATASVQSIVERPIATVATDMRRQGPQYALGNLIADAQRAAAQADVAVMNNGGIRVDLRAGPATYGSFFEIAPFANLLMRLSVTGTDLRTYFERVVGGNAVRAHVSGAMVRFDPARPAGQRIVEITIGGRPVEPTRLYTMAMSDFMASGGDGLALAGPAQQTEALGIVDLDALISYVLAIPGGVIRPDATVRLAPVR